MSQNSALNAVSVFKDGEFNLVKLDGQDHICVQFGIYNDIGEFEGVTASDPEECFADADFKVIANQADAITDSNGNEYWPWGWTEFTGRPPRTHRLNA